MERDGFRFRGGHVALDLTATRLGRLREQPRELLESGADLDRWLIAAGLSEAPAGSAADDVALARELREAIYALAMGVGGAARDQARATLNGVAALTAAAPKLLADGGYRLEGSATALMANIAREAVLLFGGEAAGRIKKCESPSCAVVFVDTSRAGRRRWCSMEACGNKAKVGEFRKRQRGGPGL